MVLFLFCFVLFCFVLFYFIFIYFVSCYSPAHTPVQRVAVMLQ